MKITIHTKKPILHLLFKGLFVTQKSNRTINPVGNNIIVILSRIQLRQAI